MNPRLLSLLATVFLLPPARLNAKPPPPARPLPSTTPAAATDESTASLLRWLLLQNGGPAAAAVPWSEIVRAAGGKLVTPLEPANPSDAAALAKLGAALDAVLPRLNRPDGSVRAALMTAEVNARAADELRASLTAESLSTPAALCPILRWNDAPGGRTVYLVLSTYPAGGKEAAVGALTVRPAELASQITTDGACLLVGIENNGKAGRELAFLNWEVVDLAKVSLRCAVTFEADANAVHVPGATLGDGRRGRD